MSIINMFAAETVIKFMVLASPTVATAYKDDLDAGSTLVISSPLHAESELDSDGRPLPKTNFNPGVAIEARRQSPNFKFDLEVGHTVEYPLPQPELQLEIASRLLSEQSDCITKDELATVVTPSLSPLEQNANKPHTGLKARELDTDPTLPKARATVTDSSPSATTDKGPYFFSIVNGTTIWGDGRTPPPSVSIVHHTSTIVVVPIASRPFNTSLYPPQSLVTATKPSNSPITSSYEHHTTTTITEISTHYLTKTLTGASHPGASSGSAPRWLSTTALTGASNPGASSGSAPRWLNTTRYAHSSPLSLTQATGASSGFAQYTGIKSSAYNSPTNTMHLNVARQLGAIVVATINGATVSWTNDYDGSDLTQSYPPSPPTTTLITVAKTTLATSLSASDTAVPPESISSTSVVPVTPSVVPTTTEIIPKGSTTPSAILSSTQLTTMSSTVEPSTSTVSTSCTETTSSKATVSTLTTPTTTTGTASASSSAACSVTARNPNNKGDFTVNVSTASSVSRRF